MEEKGIFKSQNMENQENTKQEIKVVEKIIPKKANKVEKVNKKEAQNKNNFKLESFFTKK